MVGPCGLGPILLEQTLQNQKSTLFLFWVHVAALLTILENPMTYIRFPFPPGLQPVLCKSRTHTAPTAQKYFPVA